MVVLQFFKKLCNRLASPQVLSMPLAPQMPFDDGLNIADGAIPLGWITMTHLDPSPRTQFPRMKGMATAHIVDEAAGHAR